MRMAMVVAGSALLVSGCSHEKDYAAAQARYHDALGTVASYASLLDASSFGDADRRVVVPAAQHGAVTHICTVAQDKSISGDELNDVEKRIEATFVMVAKGCCDNAPASEIATATSCNDAVRRETAALASVESEAVKAGRPPGSILPTSPPFDPVADRELAAAVHKAAAPTPEEAKLATLWAEPAATPDALKTACDAASASDPKKTDGSSDLASFVARTRAGDTWFHCNNLEQYLAVLKLDGMKEPGHDAKICELATFKHDVAPPASIKDAYLAVETKRCSP